MKTVFTLLIVIMTGCTSADLKYYFNGVPVYPEFEWVEPLIFQENLRRCRQQATCSVDQIFNRY